MLDTIYNRTAKYRSLRDRKGLLVAELTLIRVAKTHAHNLLLLCESDDELLGIILGIDFMTTITALYAEVTDGNETIREMFGLSVALLGELFESDEGKELIRKYG